MANRSHKNQGHIGMNALKKAGKTHASLALQPRHETEYTYHAVFRSDCLDLLKSLPDESIQLIVCDPPYNIQMADWDDYEDYLGWASDWMIEAKRVLAKSGNFVVFGGLQYQGEEGGGDLLSLIHYVRMKKLFNLVNLIILSLIHI